MCAEKSCVLFRLHTLMQGVGVILYCVSGSYSIQKLLQLLPLLTLQGTDTSLVSSVGTFASKDYSSSVLCF